MDHKVLCQVETLHMCVGDLHLAVATDGLTLGDLAGTLLIEHLHMGQSGLLQFLWQINLVRDAQTVPDISEFYSFLPHGQKCMGGLQSV